MIYHSFATTMRPQLIKRSFSENEFECFESLKFCNINFKMQF